MNMNNEHECNLIGGITILNCNVGPYIKTLIRNHTLEI